MCTKLISIVALLLISFNAVANPDIESWSEQGAKVLYVHTPELPMVDINVVFNAGAARDGKLSGLARMTSLMLEEGTAKMDADQIATAFANVGANYSADSERDMAVFGLRSLTDKAALDTALSTFTTVLTQPTFPDKSFRRLKQQVLRELEAEKQSPGALAERAFYKNLYADHPYASMPAGTMDTVAQIEVTDLQGFYKQYYVANNAVVAIVGDVSRARAEQIAKQLISGLEAGETAAPLPAVTVSTAAEIVRIDHPSSQTTIAMGQPGISRHDADYFALYVGNHILGGSGLVSQLSDEVREKRGLSYSVYSYFRPMLMKGPYQFGLQTRNDQAEQALQVMMDTTRAFVEKGPSKDELTAAKQNITGSFALRVDSNREIVGYLSMIGFYNLPLDYLDTFNDKVNAVTIDMIKDTFKRRVHTDKMLTVLVGGKE